MNRLEELNSLLDGELSAEKAAELTPHLATCPECARIFADLAQLRSDISFAIPKQNAPEGLARRIEAALLAEDAGSPASEPASSAPKVIPFTRRPAVRRTAWVAAPALVGLAALLMVALTPHNAPSNDLMAVRDAADRSSVAQAASSADAPAAPGFQLASARTDVIAGHVSQVYVYKGGGETITLSIWPANGEPAHPARKALYRGTDIRYWNDGKREFWAAGPEGGQALGSFVHALTAS